MMKRARRWWLWAVVGVLALIVLVCFNRVFVGDRYELSSAEKIIRRSGRNIVTFIEDYKRRAGEWPIDETIYDADPNFASWAIRLNEEPPQIFSRYMPFGDAFVMYDFAEQKWKLTIDQKRYIRAEADSEWHLVESK